MNKPSSHGCGESSTIILHDAFVVRGGGERLVLTFATDQADALCFGYCRPESFDPSVFFKGKILDLGADGGFFGLRTLKLCNAFRYRTRFLADYDVAVYSGILSPLAVYNHLDQRNVCYCHTPPRFAYDKRSECLVRLPAWKRPIMRAYSFWLRQLYSAAMARMDVIVTNSEHVRSRVQRYLGLDALVVYPPIDTSGFVWRGQSDYYLSTARHDQLKRVDIIIKAFIDLPDKKLVVTSGGADTSKLKMLANGASNITFTGLVDEESLRDLVGRAVATVYIPQHEDFGMSPVESMAAGKPVLGVAEGGLLETIQDGRTGVLLAPDPKPEDVAAAVRDLSPAKALSLREACETHAQQFDTKLFLKKMRAILGSEANTELLLSSQDVR